MLCWRLQGVFFCCSLLLEARNSCAESYKWKQRKFLSPVSELQYVALSVHGFKRTIIFKTQGPDNHICTLAVSLQNYYISNFLLIFILLQREEDCVGGKRPTPTQAHNTTVSQNFKPRDTHSLLRFSSPVKAPLVSSIVPEMSLWSSSLGRGQERAHNQCLSPRHSKTSPLLLKQQ